jgi:hypothetical protein
MNTLLKPGRIIFATGLLALGVICFISKDFIVGRPPAWQAGTHSFTGIYIRSNINNSSYRYTYTKESFGRFFAYCSIDPCAFSIASYASFYGRLAECL